jgi:hypothetical protein
VCSLARALRHVDTAQALSHLAPLFTKPKAAFCLNMFILPVRETPGAGPGRGRGRRKKPASAGAPAAPAPAAPAAEPEAVAEAAAAAGAEGGGGDAAAAAAAVPEADFGLAPPGRVVGIGMSDSPAHFRGEWRAAALLYLDLLAEAGALEALHAAAAFFQAAPGLQGAGYDDLRALSQGQFVLALLAAAHAACPLEAVARDDGDEEPPAPGSSPAPGPAPPPAASPRERQRRRLRALAAGLDPGAADPALSRLYDLWARHTWLREAGADWGSAVVAPARAALSLRPGGGGAGGALLRGLLRGGASLPAAGLYAELHVHVLARAGAADRLRALLLPLKRRCGRACFFFLGRVGGWVGGILCVCVFRWQRRVLRDWHGLQRQSSASPRPPSPTVSIFRFCAGTRR